MDVVGSTQLAEQMGSREFSKLMNSFYATATNALIDTDAFIDKLVGDEVMALYMPIFTGSNHAGAAIRAAQALLRDAEQRSPVLPISIGVHSGVAWVGTVGGADDSMTDITALGDPVNVAARLASKAESGEALISEAACNSAGIETNKFEKRELDLKGKSALLTARVFRALPEPVS